jgi:hypothetical protein
MAIEKTVFTGTTQAANAPEVYEFLNANKAGYFDSVVMDETTNAITCYVGETAAFVMNFDGVAKSAVTTAANGSSIDSNRKDLTWSFGVVTSKGLALYGTGGSGSGSPFDIIISKNNNGNPIIVFKGLTGSSASNQYFYTSDILDGIVHNLMGFNQNSFYEEGITALTQLPLSATDATYAPDVYLTFFGQYLGTRGKLAANGKEYYYTGHIALSD